MKESKKKTLEFIERTNDLNLLLTQSLLEEHIPKNRLMVKLAHVKAWIEIMELALPDADKEELTKMANNRYLEIIEKF